VAHKNIRFVIQSRHNPLESALKLTALVLPDQPKVGHERHRANDQAETENRHH